MKRSTAAGFPGTALLLFLLFAQSGCHRSETSAQTPRDGDSPTAQRRARVRLDPVIADNLVSRIRSDSIENEDGQALGNVKDVVVETATGSVVYVVVTSGGFLSIGEKTVAIPARSLSLATTLRDTLAINISEARWKGAPALPRGVPPGELNGTQTREIAQYFRQDPLSSDQNPRKFAEREHPSLAAPTGRSSPQIEVQRSPNHRLALTSELLGMTLINAQHVKLGKVVDLLVDLAGQKPTYAIVLTEHLLERTERIAVPFGLLHWVDDKLLVDVSPKTFEQAQHFTGDAWRKNSHPTGQIYLFAANEGH